MLTIEFKTQFCQCGLWLQVVNLDDSKILSNDFVLLEQQEIQYLQQFNCLKTTTFAFITYPLLFLPYVCQLVISVIIAVIVVNVMVFFVANVIAIL